MAAIANNALAKHPEVEARVVHTRQHYAHQMSQAFFDEPRIPAPVYNLEVGLE